MTTQTTTIQTSTTGLRALIGAAAANLALLGGTLLWQPRSASETATLAPTTVISTSREGVAPLGGLAEQYRDQARAAVGSPQPPAVVTEPESTLNAPYLDAAMAITPTSDTTGGMAELYRDQAEGASSVE